MYECMRASVRPQKEGMSSYHVLILRMVKEYGMRTSMRPFGVYFLFLGGASKWWKILDEDTKLYSTW
jgi:hypothetical protein